MIRSYADEATRDIHHEVTSKKAAAALGDLATPGSNLEKLKGALAGRYSIRINDQWRIVFRFEGDSAFDVAIVDYH